MAPPADLAAAGGSLVLEPSWCSRHSTGLHSRPHAASCSRFWEAVRAWGCDAGGRDALGQGTRVLSWGKGLPDAVNGVKGPQRPDLAVGQCRASRRKRAWRS